MAANDEAAPASESASATEVRQLFATARSEVNTFHSLHLGRHVAEAVCKALRHSVPADHQAAYRKLETLHDQISYLEKNAEKLGVYRVVTSALRTLQAYGNYAAHHEAGRKDERPPTMAAESTMASLDLVVQWFINRERPGAGEDSLEQKAIPLQLHEPARPPPSWLARWRLWRYCPDSPVLKFDDDTTPGSKLARLFAYYDKSCELARYVGKVVLEREADANVADMGPAVLCATIRTLADSRPERVPRATARDIQELFARRTMVHQAMKDNTSDADRHKEAQSYVIEAEQRNLGEGLREWFGKHYLGRTRVERWWLGACLLVGAAFLARSCLSDFVSGERRSGAAGARRQMLSRYCESAQDAGAQSLCADLQKQVEEDAKADKKGK